MLTHPILAGDINPAPPVWLAGLLMMVVGGWGIFYTRWERTRRLYVKRYNRWRGWRHLPPVDFDGLPARRKMLFQLLPFVGATQIFIGLIVFASHL